MSRLILARLTSSASAEKMKGVLGPPRAVSSAQSTSASAAACAMPRTVPGRCERRP